MSNKHKVENPSTIYRMEESKRFSTSSMSEKRYFDNRNNIVREERYHDDNILSIVFYHENEITSFDDKPCLVKYDKFGNIYEEYYGIKSKKHRLGKPAVIQYDKGEICKVEYWKEHIKHNENGPQTITFNEDGSVREKEYYIDNISLTEEQFIIKKRQLIINKINHDEF